MVNLWLAIVIYCIGLGILLYTRPSFMFMDNGAWKEFGYQRGPRYTIFPFWLFAIAWAVLSYTLAAVAGIMLTGSGSRVASFMAASSAATTATIGHSGYNWEDVSEEMEDDEEEAVEAVEAPRRPRGRPRKIVMPASAATPPVAATAAAPRAGYYVLEEKPQGEAGLRRYVYYGERPPTD
jgi:hypothetical protein